MITLLIGASTLVALTLGWYGHKAVLRINAWGLNMNDRDRDFRKITHQEITGDFESTRALARADELLVRAANLHLTLR